MIDIETEEDGYILYDEEPNPSLLSHDEYLKAMKMYSEKSKRSDIFTELTNKFESWLNDRDGNYYKRGLKSNAPEEAKKAYNEYIQKKKDGFWRE